MPWPRLLMVFGYKREISFFLYFLVFISIINFKKRGISMTYEDMYDVLSFLKEKNITKKN